MNDSRLPFHLETELEKRIAADPEWREGVEWGRPRRGHPEGPVKAHIADVLRNVDELYGDSPFREKLRVIALVHDSFKFQVDRGRSRTGENHHAVRARRFAERYICDPSTLDVIELHDEAYNAWQKGNRDGKWDKAYRRIGALVDRLGDSLPLYLAFYRCDNTTEGKQPDGLEWFQEVCRNRSTGKVRGNSGSSPEGGQMTNRKSRAKLAKQTLEILDRGCYMCPAGSEVRIGEWLRFARENSVLYTPEMFSEVFVRRDAVVGLMSRVRTAFDVINATTLLAGRGRIREEDHVDYVCLNFASAKTPGGGFLAGSQAQEESLARSSGLYPCIEQMDRMYEANRRCGTCLYTDHMIYSPRVPVIRDDDGELLEQPYRLSILTVPAVNTGAIVHNEPHSVDRITSTMIGRIEKLLSVAIVHRHRRVILGAWGCGVFKNDPDHVAQWFYDQLTGNPAFEGVFENVIFAVPDESEQRHFIGPFEQRFLGIKR